MELFNGVSEVMRYWITDIAVFIGVLREVMVKWNILPHNLRTVREDTHKKLWSL